MCGIAGILRFDGRTADPERVERALGLLRHRGPDERGVVTRGGCTLLHARLSVVDLAGGGQPMEATASGSHGPLSVVFNGMIYNHRALRRELEALGHRFVSDHSDTEVLLHGHWQWGTDLPARLEGMFAFAIWDDAAHTLLLCRDRMGKKPLYVQRAPGAFAFAGLIEPLMVLSAAERRMNREAMLTFLRFGYTFERSLNEGVEELPPGHLMKVSADGRFTTRRYWQLPARSQPMTVRGDLEALETALDAAVRKRLDADVPLGCFLSGGIDSSVVAALAQRALMEQGGQSLQTFSVRMPFSDYDESRYARLVADHIGSQHVELFADPSVDVMGDLAALIRIMGEPTADSSLLPTYWLSRAAREHVTVALSGDGGDEVFAGYDRYRAMRLLQRHAAWLRRLPAVKEVAGRPHAWRTRLHRLQAAARCETPAAQYAQIMHLFDSEQLRQLGFDTPDEDFAAPDWPDEPDPVAAALAWDREHYLPFDLLRKVDRASMAVALEVRCPMLDTAVVELAVSLPVEVLMPGGRPKGLLRQLAAKLLPRDIARRPKRGFAVPIGRWFRHEWNAALRDHLLSGELENLGLNRSALERMIHEHTVGRHDHTHRLFALLTLSLWAAKAERTTNGH